MNYTELNHFQFRYHKYNFNVKDEVYIIKNRFFFHFQTPIVVGVRNMSTSKGEKREKEKNLDEKQLERQTDC